MMGVPGLDAIKDPFKRFASMILAVPEEEAEKENKTVAKEKNDERMWRTAAVARRGQGNGEQQ